MTADYNGWTDLPEAEREALDVQELAPVASDCRSHPPAKVFAGKSPTPRRVAA